MDGSTTIGRRPRLLVVDDSQLIRRIVYDFFMKAGYRVDEADDGHDALEAIERHPPDVIIADILMPKMDGWRLFEEVRKRQVTVETPFVFLTTEKELPKRLRGLKAGADDYITKPFEVEELHARVERLLERHRLLQDARKGKGAMLAGSTEHLSMPDLLQLLSLNVKDGKLDVWSGRLEGTIYFESGEIVHATSGMTSGLKAFYRILGWEGATFRVTEKSGPVESASISGKIQNILMDAMVSLDEWKRWKDSLPGKRAYLKLIGGARDRLEGRRVSVVEFEVMARVKKGRNVGQILEESSQPDGALAAAICSLMESGVLEVRPSE